MSLLDILALAGGKFGALRIIATFLFSFFMPALKFNFILENIAEVRHQPTKPDGYQNLDLMKIEALKVIKGRGKYTSTCW